MSAISLYCNDLFLIGFGVLAILQIYLNIARSELRDRLFLKILYG
jgi:hypothetical protein